MRWLYLLASGSASLAGAASMISGQDEKGAIWVAVSVLWLIVGSLEDRR